MKRMAWVLPALALALAGGCGKEAVEGESPLGIPDDGSRMAVRASVEPSCIRVGDSATYRLEVVHPTGARVEIPDLRDGNRVVVRDGGTDTEAAGEGWERTTGRWTVTSLTVTNENGIGAGGMIRLLEGGETTAEAEMPFANLEVSSSLPPEAEGAEEIPLRPAFGELLEWPRAPMWWVLWGALGLAAAGAAVWAAIWWARRPRPAPVVPAVPPDVAALAALAALRKKLDAGECGGAEPFFVEVSGIVRRYLEGRFGLRAPRATTEEFIVMAAGEPRLGDKQKRAVEAFLEVSDRVKFARYEPGGAAMREALDVGERLVEETRPREAGEGNHEPSERA
jgi:hypothetical protein